MAIHHYNCHLLYSIVNLQTYYFLPRYLQLHSSSFCTLAYFFTTRAMLARYMLSSCVCPSVHLSIRLSQRWLNLGSHKQHRTIAHGGLVFRRQKSQRNSNQITPKVAPNRGGVGSNRRFLTNISLYLRNGARR